MNSMPAPSSAPRLRKRTSSVRIFSISRWKAGSHAYSLMIYESTPRANDENGGTTFIPPSTSLSSFSLLSLNSICFVYKHTLSEIAGERERAHQALLAKIRQDRIQREHEHKHCQAGEHAQTERAIEKIERDRNLNHQEPSLRKHKRE